MEQLKKDIKKYALYSSFPMTCMKQTITKDIYSTYINTLHYARATYMMNMYINEPESDFFDIPSAPSIFQSVYQRVQSVLISYPPMFIQNLVQQIAAIYLKPVHFAANVDLYFRQDMTDHVIFSHSTFPAIFSFFLGDEFGQSACEFLSAIFRSTKNLILSESLLSSFFESASVFYDCFFNVIGDHLFDLTLKGQNKFTKNNQTVEEFYKQLFDNRTEKKGFLSKRRISTSKPTSNDQIVIVFFNVFLNSFKMCLRLFSKHHLEALKNFILTFPTDPHKFFLREVILKPFITATKSSISLVSSSANKYFIYFIYNLLQFPQDSIYIKQLLSTITDFLSDSLYFQSIYPQLKGFVWKQGVPLLLSHFDIKLICDIFSSADLFTINLGKAPLNFNRSFDAFNLNIFPSFCGKCPPEQGIISTLFHGMPPTYNEALLQYQIGEKSTNNKLALSVVESTDDFNIQYDQVPQQKLRTWRKILAYTNSECLNLTDFLLNPPSNFSFIRNDPTYYFILLNYYHNTFRSIEETILMKEALEKLENLKDSNRQRTYLCFHHFSFSFLKERIKTIENVLPAICSLAQISLNKTAITKNSGNNKFLLSSAFKAPENDFLSNLPRSVLFEISMSALDTLPVIEHTVDIEMAEADFENELMEWIDSIWPTIEQANPILTKRHSSILDISKFLSHVAEGGYGRRFKIILNFVKELKLILTDNFLHLWKPTFHYAIFCSSQKQIFSTFLYLYHFVLEGLKLDEWWDIDVQNCTSMFTAGMLSIVERNPSINTKYCQPKYLSKLFHKKSFHNGF